MVPSGWPCLGKVQQSVGGAASFPQHITLRTPMLSLGNQQWNNLSIVSQPTANGTQVEAQGREINATLAMRNNAPWLANISNIFITRPRRGENSW